MFAAGLLFPNSSAIEETLEARGVLAQLKARIRSEVFAALDDEVGPRALSL